MLFKVLFLVGSQCWECGMALKKATQTFRATESSLKGSTDPCGSSPAPDITEAGNHLTSPQVRWTEEGGEPVS